jgi:hypothetical protein
MTECDLREVDKQLVRVSDSLGVTLEYLINNVNAFDYAVADKVIGLLSRKVEILEALIKAQSRAHLKLIK